MISPKSEQIKNARIRAGLTQAQAAALIYKNLRTWQQWEAGDRKMDAAFFELFIQKSKSITDSTGSGALSGGNSGFIQKSKSITDSTAR